LSILVLQCRNRLFDAGVIVDHFAQGLDHFGWVFVLEGVSAN
jgi:hypothetical protein